MECRHVFAFRFDPARPDLCASDLCVSGLCASDLERLPLGVLDDPLALVVAWPALSPFLLVVAVFGLVAPTQGAVVPRVGCDVVFLLAPPFVAFPVLDYAVSLLVPDAAFPHAIAQGSLVEDALSRAVSLHQPLEHLFPLDPAVAVQRDHVALFHGLAS